MTITEEDLARLEALAQAATPGPMHSTDTSVWSPITEVARCRDYNPNGLADARFFAAARDAVPALVAEVRRLHKQVRGVEIDWHNICDQLSSALAERDALRAELAEEKRYLLADEERRKLTGDALAAEAEAAELRASLADAVGKIARMEPLLQRCVQVIQAVAPDHEVLDAVDAYEAS